MHLNSELLLREYALKYFTNVESVLEIGPAGFPSAYQKIINNNSIEWHTIDFENTTFIESAVDSLTYKLQSPYSFPIESEKYEVILSGQVIEHVEKIWVWLKEIKRVLKKGGYIILINPVSWPYHEAPIDCWRIYPAGMKALADDLELTVELSLFESLEARELKKKDPKAKVIPGKSYDFPPGRKKVIKKILSRNKLLRKLPFHNPLFEIPVEVAFDTISVLRK